MKRFQDYTFRDAMKIRVDFNNMMEGFVPNGVNPAEIEANEALYAEAAAAMENKRDSMKWRDLPFNQEEIVKQINEKAAEIRDNCEYFVVLGIGGSALGPIAVHQALCHLRYNELPRDKRNGPKLFVEDNVDPERMASLFEVIDLKKTIFNVITKSGSTSETMAQLLLVTDALKKEVGDDWAKHIVATTDHNKGNLIKIAAEFGMDTFYVPDGVGGRFSELCPVGLLAAAVCGIDIEELLAGAAFMDKLCENSDIWHNPAYMMAALQVLAIDRGCNINVMMPYADSLKYMADWFAQLWAESLGKATDNDGNEVYAGQTPVKSLGVTDQHSQVQLYTEGPFDKVITFLAVDNYRTTVTIPHAYDHIPDVAFLSGHTFNKLIQSEQFATEYAIRKSGHMTCTVTLPEVNPFTVGQLLCLFELMTAYAGELLNINAFDQPGVEEGKNATYALLGKPGYEAKKAELDAAPEKQARYII